MTRKKITVSQIEDNYVDCYGPWPTRSQLEKEIQEYIKEGFEVTDPENEMRFFRDPGYGDSHKEGE